MGYISSFGLTSFCIRLKGTACVACQLLRQGTEGTDICILFLFLFNDVNGKKKKKKNPERLLPIRDLLVQAKYSLDRDFSMILIAT